MQWRLRSQLALVIAVAMAPAGIVAILQVLSGANDEIKQREAVFAGEMRATTLRERDALQQVRVALAATADAAEEALLATGECDTVLERFATSEPGLGHLALLDEQGSVVCGAKGWWSAGDLPQWKRFVEGREPLFTLAPEADDEGAWRVVALHPTVFMQPRAFAIAAEITLSEFGTPGFSGEDGRIRGVMSDAGVLVTESTAGAPGWLPSNPTPMLSNVGMVITDSSRRGEERLYITQPLVDGQLWAIASVPKARLIDVVGSAAGLIVLGPVLLWMVAIVVAYVSIDKLVTRHVVYLGRAAGRIGRGDLGSEVRRLDAAPREIRALGDAIRDMAGNLRDRDARMRAALERQKSLILEIHHRVKNNLQMVGSLINIRLRRAKSSEERDALRFLENRVQSLAIIHQHLYGSEELNRVALDELVRDICERLSVSMAPADAIVEFRYRLTPLVVNSRVATPTALFLTEAVSNVFKHAVPETGTHSIDIVLETDDSYFTLEVGNEMTHAVPTETEGGHGLGMRLLRSFASQLDGEYRKSVDAGSFRLSLRAPLAPRRGDVPGEAGSGPAAGTTVARQGEQETT